MQHLDEDRQIVYFQNYGGGGEALGLLFGPFGAAANASMIEKNTKSDVEMMYGKINVNPRTVFEEMARRQGLVLSTDPTSDNSRITPYLYISKTDGEGLLIATAIIIEQGSGADRWVGKYMYQLPATYSVGSLAELDENALADLRSATADGFLALLGHIASEGREQHLAEQQITFKSDFLNPRFDFELRGTLISFDKELVWICTVGGVYAVRKANISYIRQQL
jgi:hypothetical protein